MKQAIPRQPADASVCAYTLNRSALAPLLTHALAPSSRQPRPSRRAVVVIAAASLPPCGSVSRKAPICLPAISPGSQRARCGVLALRVMPRARLLCTVSANAEAMQAVARASTTRAMAGMLSPWPCMDGGTVRRHSPRAAASWKASRGTPPASSQAPAFGSITSRANARAAFTTFISRSEIGGMTAARPFMAVHQKLCRQGWGREPWYQGLPGSGVSRLRRTWAGARRMPKGGFEPPRPVRHHPLKMACLPFPPLRHVCAPGKPNVRGGKKVQHSACARPLSNGFIGSADAAIASVLPALRARVHFPPAALLRGQSAARAGRWRPGPDP